MVAFRWNGWSLSLDYADGSAGDSNRQKLINVVRAFSAGVSTQAIVGLEPIDPSLTDLGLDTHSPAAAGKHPQLYRAVVQAIDGFLEFFKEATVEIPSQGVVLPLKDCCSFSITSEFNRTLRQRNKPITDTGTNHNPSGNSVLVGGSGLRGGLVIGASDLDTLGGGSFDSAEVSGYHKSLDPELLMVFGKAYDFQTGMPLPANLEGASASDVTKRINFANVLNTIAASRGVPKSQWLRSGGARPQDLEAIADLIKS